MCFRAIEVNRQNQYYHRAQGTGSWGGIVIELYLFNIYHSYTRKQERANTASFKISLKGRPEFAACKIPLRIKRER